MNSGTSFTEVGNVADFFDIMHVDNSGNYIGTISQSSSRQVTPTTVTSNGSNLVTFTYATTPVANLQLKVGDYVKFTSSTLFTGIQSITGRVTSANSTTTVVQYPSTVPTATGSPINANLRNINTIVTQKAGAGGYVINSQGYAISGNFNDVENVRFDYPVNGQFTVALCTGNSNLGTTDIAGSKVGLLVGTYGSSIPLTSPTFVSFTPDNDFPADNYTTLSVSDDYTNKNAISYNFATPSTGTIYQNFEGNFAQQSTPVGTGTEPSLYRYSSSQSDGSHPLYAGSAVGNTQAGGVILTTTLLPNTIYPNLTGYEIVCTSTTPVSSDYKPTLFSNITGISGGSPVNGRTIVGQIITAPTLVNGLYTWNEIIYEILSQSVATYSSFNHILNNIYNIPPVIPTPFDPNTLFNTTEFVASGSQNLGARIKILLSDLQMCYKIIVTL